MNKLAQTGLLVIVGLVAVGAVAPALSRLAEALIPLVLVVGVVIAVLHLVRHFTTNR
jgi:hypothetical protein